METHREALRKFIIVLLVFLAYFAYVAYHYGVKDGLIITLLTWSFFVLSTPIADAGFLLDFPLRILTGMRMVKAEMIVWAIAISLNVYFVLFHPEVYQTTTLLQVFYHILTHPIPYWSIIVLSAIGTFLSVHFGDELLDVFFHSERRKYFLHKEKYELVA
ncbi:MAG: hypothetical protein GXO00_01220, partial [Candidatus Diapherotrites archaeon]|nr:hypothetical protein [Candidatus Diapherotrites archaeon]